MRQIAFGAGLSAEQAQAVYAAFNSTFVETWKKAMKERADSTPAFVEGLRKDLGDKLTESNGNVARALVRFDKGGKLRELLAQPEWGNNRAVYDFLTAAGAELREDSSARGRTKPGAGQETAADRLKRLYPSMAGEE